MKGIKIFFSICCAALVLQGCGHIAKSKDTEMSNKVLTQKHCFGRYEVELPDYMFMYSGNYSFDNFRVEAVRAVRTDYATIENDWVKYVKNTIAPDMRKGTSSYGSKIAHQDMKSNPRVLMEYMETTNDVSSLSSLYMFRTFYLKDVPERKEWLVIDGQGIELPRPLPDAQLRQQIQHKLDAQMDDINKITYKPYPHYAPGYCLDNEYHYYPGRLEKRDYYHMVWHSNVENSRTFLSVDVESYNKDEEDKLESRISKGKLLRTFFSSTTVEVGGIKGELYISRDSSTPSAREFQWIPGDSEAGNRMKPLIKIAGRFDTHDLPAELRNKVSGEELILWILESLKMRKGADEDIQMFRR